MVKIITPVSEFFRDPYVLSRIADLSDGLEGRDRTYDIEPGRQTLFHFDLSIVNEWCDEHRVWVEGMIRAREALELVSFHVAACCSAPVVVGYMFHPGGNMFSRARLLANAAQNIAWLKAITVGRNIRVAVENNNYYPTFAYEYVTDPDFITQLVKDNGIGFLFDVAHARIAAVNRKLAYRDYFVALPIERMLQVHVSRWGVDANGVAFDAHEAPDQALNEEVVTLVKAQGIEYLTIEYYHEPGKLLRILETYRQMLGLK